MDKSKIKLSEVEIGKSFIADDGVEYIKFSENDGASVVLTKEILFLSTFGDNNNFATSKVLKRLQNEILPNTENLIGADNIIQFSTDLTTLDGLKTYGSINSKISLPTLDFYRKNLSFFEKHKLDDSFWLATAESSEEHGSDAWTLRVAPSGYVDGGICYCSRGGVRPILRFKSFIFVSCTT